MLDPLKDTCTVTQILDSSMRAGLFFFSEECLTGGLHLNWC